MIHLERLDISSFFESMHGFEELFETVKPFYKVATGIKGFLGSFSLDENGNFISPTAQIHPTAIMKNSYIGHDAKIYEFVSIRDSLIGDGTIVGHCGEIARSIILANCSMPRFNYIGSSIVGSNVRFGGICSLATRRFNDADVAFNDRGKTFPTYLSKFGSIIGDNCLIGFSVHCNPGTIIGKNCLIMPQTELTGVIQPNSIVSSKQKLIISRKRDLSKSGLLNLTTM